MTHHTRRQRFLKNILSFLVAVVLLELMAQAVKAYVLPPKWWKVAATDRLEPGYKGPIDYADTVEGRGARLGVLCVNSLGFRGPERRLSNERAPNRLLIYCLGSSTTFGWGASADAKTYPAQLDKNILARLKSSSLENGGQGGSPYGIQRPSHPISQVLPFQWEKSLEVINAGVPGNNSQSELRILEQDLPSLKPDIVILWSGWPDWGHYMQPTGRKIKHARDPLALLKKSASYRCCEYLRDLITARPAPPSDRELAARTGLGGFRTEALEKFRVNLEKMIGLCRKHATFPVVLGLATPLRMDPSTLSPLARSQAANRLNAFPNATQLELQKGILDFDAAIKRLCIKTHTDYIPPELLPCDPVHFIDGVHLTDEGNAALAEAIASQIAALFPLPY